MLHCTVKEAAMYNDLDDLEDIKEDMGWPMNEESL
jgi:hypothetical protein